jgi:hypothetical protein
VVIVDSDAGFGAGTAEDIAEFGAEDVSFGRRVRLEVGEGSACDCAAVGDEVNTVRKYDVLRVGVAELDMVEGRRGEVHATKNPNGTVRERTEVEDRVGQGPGEGGVAEVALFEVDAVEARGGEVAPVEEGADEYGAAEVGAGE